MSYKSLQDKGIPDAVLDRIEAKLPSAMSLDFVVNPTTVGIEWCATKFDLGIKALSSPNFNLLEALGYSKEEILLSNKEICGAGTVHGAPDLLDQHLDVFDCASMSWSSARTIAPMGHIDMLAAIQPTISGAISKTANLPEDISISSVAQIYSAAEKKGLKAVAIYRKGSKFSEILASVGRQEGADGPPAVEAVAKEMTRSVRRLLPQRRVGYTQKSNIGGHTVYLRTGEYEDGTLGEIFLGMHREGASFRGIMNAFAIAVSLGLQHGVPLEKFVDAFIQTRFEPAGLVQGHDSIKMSTSVLDLVFRDLAWTYLGRGDLVHIQGTVPRPSLPPTQSVSALTDMELRAKTAVDQGYTGESCPNCGNFTLVRSGTCFKCMSCGSTTGCS